ncbi:guanylate kinase [Desulfobaculum xiamenense]|uniref:Guanylate kinase n=1 Tax=Desulfobaculum xiamenense TaxID=995050 RepID=A0A846QWG8_9BACT|nr:guanylate kinase [Desulfobaculum xiamenense]NJB69454.1 guanylate kinase [Desulfobaculum xiamenense]
MNRRGLMLVICAPSGTGKSTLIKRLREEFPRISFSISYTTRAPRAGERNGVDYHFVSMENFRSLAAEGFFAEWAEVHGNCYGTPKQAIIDLLEEGQDILFDIDVQGAAQLRENMEEGCYVFLFPPSMAALRQRLENRNTDDDKTIRRRIENAPGEIAQSDQFDYWIVNDDLDYAYRLLKSVYLAEGTRPCYMPGLPKWIMHRKIDA